MKLCYSWLISLTLLSYSSYTQSTENLVPNGDFEQLISDSLIHDFLKVHEFNVQMKDWITPSHGSTDILNTKFRYDEVAPFLSGEYAVGMKVNTYYSTERRKKERYTEYAQCQLKEPLKVDKKYLVRFDISGKNLPTDASQYLGIAFSAKPIKDYYTNILPLTPQVKMTTPLKKEWQTVRQLFTPKENFEYLTIGFFDKGTELEGVFFAVDNVVVTEVSGSKNAMNAYLDFLGEEVTLSNVHFNTNSSELLENSFSELDKAVTWLQEHPEFMIEVQGHTDSDGEDGANQTLSENRATSVKNYLLEKGIPDYQIQTKGFGETVPIASNETDEGRALNRRVVLKKIKVLSNEDLYAEAIKYTRENDYDNAFATFRRMTILSQLPIQMLIDPDFKVLHRDKRWKSQVEMVIYKNFEQSVRYVRNKPLAFDLTIILLENQTLMQEDSIFWKNIRPFTGDFQFSKQNVDFMKQRHGEQINELLGDLEILPGRFDISIKGIMAIFTVAQKSNDLAFQKEWLKKMENASHSFPEYKSFVAYLTDKIAKLENRPQIYGTQIIEGKMYQVIEPEKINERRVKMNLSRIDINDYK